MPDFRSLMKPEIPGRGIADQPIPEVAEAEAKGFGGEQEIEYEFPPTKVVVVNLPKPAERKQRVFRVGIISIVAGITSIPRSLVGKRSTRTRILVKNLGPDPIFYSHETNVTDQSGWPITATDQPLEMLNMTEPIFVTVLDATKSARIAVHEEYEIPYKA